MSKDKSQKLALRITTILDRKEDPTKELFIIFQELIREATQEMKDFPPETAKGIAKLYEMRARVWEIMIDEIGNPGILRSGFRTLLKEYAPRVYYAIRAEGFGPVPVDEVEAQRKLKKE
jgi:hypothetical protein